MVFRPDFGICKLRGRRSETANVPPVFIVLSPNGSFGNCGPQRGLKATEVPDGGPGVV